MKKYSVYKKVEWSNNLIWVRSFYENLYRKGNSYKTAQGAKRAAKRFIEKQQREIGGEWILIEEAGY